MRSLLNHPHEIADQRSLAIAREAAKALRRDPARHVAEARERIRRWKSINPSRGFAEWETILEKPVDEIIREMLDESEYGQDIRQNNPFSVIVGERKRQNIFRRVKASR